MRFLAVAVAGLLTFDSAAAYQIGVRARRRFDHDVDGRGRVVLVDGRPHDDDAAQGGNCRRRTCWLVLSNRCVGK